MKKLIIALSIITMALAGCANNNDLKANIFGTTNPASVKEIIANNLNNPDFVIMDVRTPQEYAEMHLPGATNTDYRAENFKDELEKMNKEKSYLIYCRTGVRSSEAYKIMTTIGFNKVYNLQGGITKWMEEGNPVVK